MVLTAFIGEIQEQEKKIPSSDLAKIYRVETKVFNQAVKRNAERFPENFCFQLTSGEWESLGSQIVTLNANCLNQKV